MVGLLKFKKKVYGDTLKEQHIETLKRYIYPDIVEEYIKNEEYEKLYYMAQQKIPPNTKDGEKALNKLMDLRVRGSIKNLHKHRDLKPVLFMWFLIALGLIDLILWLIDKH